MGDGARRTQMERRFGLGQPVDTYGEPCPYANQIIKKFDEKEFAFIREISQGPRVSLPRHLVNQIEKGGLQVEIINPKTGKTYSFYRELRDVRSPVIHIPEMVDIDSGQEVIMKIRSLSKSKFIRQLDGKTAEMIRLNDDGNVTVNLNGKEIPMRIGDLKYSYTKSAGDLGGAKHLEFGVQDAFGKSYVFRIYDNGYNEPRPAISAEGEFRFIEDIDYDTRRDAVVMKYYRKGATAGTTIRFMEPGEIDIDKGMAPEEMRLRIVKAFEIDDRTTMGEVGEEIASKFAKEKLKAIVFEKDSSTGPDRKITLNGELGILEAKLTTYKSQLETQFAQALYDVCRRFKENKEYRQGVAVGVHFSKDTGFFDIEHNVITPETQQMAFKGLHVVSSIKKKVKALGIDLDETSIHQHTEEGSEGEEF